MLSGLAPKYTKRPWQEEEDKILREAIEKLGVPEISGGKGSGKTHPQWTDIAALIPERVAKQCRERWRNHLDPSVSRQPWTEEENEILLQRYEKYGSSWAEIASGMPGRPDNGCKNQWNKLMGKGRERVRSDRRASKANSATKPRTSSSAKPCKGAPARPAGRRAASPKPTNRPDVGEADKPQLVRDVRARATEDQNRANLFLQHEEEARRLSLDSEPSSPLLSDSLHGRANLMLEIMDTKSSPTRIIMDTKPSPTHNGLASKSRVSTASVWRPPRRPAVTQNGTPDPFAFARDELIAAPQGIWAHGGEGHDSVAVTGVSVSHVEQDELELVNNFAGSAMDVDEKQRSRMTTPLNDEPVFLTEPTAKMTLSRTEVREPEAENQSSPGGVKGQKRQRSDEPTQFSPELELIGEGREADGNEPKRVALDKMEGKYDSVNAAANVCATKEGNNTLAMVSTEVSAQGLTMVSTECGVATSESKAHSPAVSPVDCEGSIQSAVPSHKVVTGSTAQPGKAENGLQGPRLLSRSKTSLINGVVDATVSMGTDGEGVQQPSPSAFRRLSSPRGTLNLG